MSRANRIARLVAIQQDTEFVLLKHRQGKHDQATHGSWDTDRSNNKSDFKYPVQDAIDKVVKGEVGKVVPTDAEFWLDQMADRKDNPDLTNLEIVGTQLFTRDNLGIMRDQMPQVPSGAKDEFLSEMKQRGIGVTREDISPQKLHPIQAEISASKTGMILRDLKERGHKKGDGARIVVSSDGYVIDGHHRWAASAFMSLKDEGEKIPVLRVDMTHMELIDVVRAWNKAMDIKPIALGESNTFKKAWIEFELAVIKGILTTEMQKHLAGQHDQSTHGAWAEGVDEYPEAELSILFKKWQKTSRAQSAWLEKRGLKYAGWEELQKIPERAAYEEFENKMNALNEERWTLQKKFFTEHINQEVPYGGVDFFGPPETDEKVIEFNRIRNRYVVADTPTLKMNKHLREGGKPNVRSREADKMTKSGTIIKPFGVYRGAVLSQEIVDSLKVGTSFTDKGFQSADVTRSGAEFYARQRQEKITSGAGELVTFRMTLTEGLNAVNVGFGEIVIKRDANMKITGKNKVDNVWVIDVDVTNG
jgi:hypothetical protein